MSRRPAARPLHPSRVENVGKDRSQDLVNEEEYTDQDEQRVDPATEKRQTEHDLSPYSNRVRSETRLREA
jgi:hypothetical protein